MKILPNMETNQARFIVGAVQKGYTVRILKNGDVVATYPPSRLRIVMSGRLHKQPDGANEENVTVYEYDEERFTQRVTTFEIHT